MNELNKPHRQRQHRWFSRTAPGDMVWSERINHRTRASCERAYDSRSTSDMRTVASALAAADSRAGTAKTTKHSLFPAMRGPPDYAAFLAR